jgi:hypothetical protein
MSMYISPSTPKEFIERTKAILTQYRARESYLGDQYFNVTLMLNCMMALVVLPREHKINGISDKAIPSILEKTHLISVNESGTAIEIGFKKYIIGLRNGIVHWGQKESLEFESEEDKIISIIIIGTSNWQGKRNRPDRYHKHTYRFGLLDGNDLDSAIREILAFVYAEGY